MHSARKSRMENGQERDRQLKKELAIADENLLANSLHHGSQAN
jgi:hypothetical protein